MRTNWPYQCLSARVARTNKAATHVCIETQTWCQSNGQVGEQSHEEGRERRDGCSRGDKVLSNLVHAEHVRVVVDAKVRGRAFAGSTRI